MRIGGWRALSWVTVALFLTGGALIVAAVAALPHPLTGGYISEAGVAGFARDGFYRAGMLAVSIGLLMLSAAARPAALALTAAGLLGLVSTSVHCSSGCPLPPYESPTTSDLIHAGASIAAVALIAMAMLILAVRDSRMQRLSRRWFALAAPALAAMAILLVTLGRSAATAIVERISLTAVLGWLVTVAISNAAAAPDRPHWARGRGTSR